MRQIFLLFSHELTKPQQKDLEENFQVNHFLYLPPKLQKLWSHVPPEPSSIKDHLEEIFSWIQNKARPQDLALVQGDFGATYMAVDFCKKLGLTPLYATSQRDVVEEAGPGDSVLALRTFSHVRFRPFESWS